MKMSKMLVPTQREVPAEAEIKSHQLMLRAGMMRKSAAGIYNYLPLGLRTLRKVENIIRKSMDEHGAIEVLMPALLPAESYMASGRWEVFGDNMFRLKDRNGRDFCLGPTHEELFTELVKNEVHSYKDLPMTIYQIQTKYRDESRPRFGIMRGREFVMKDAYSFDMDAEGLDKSYKNMYAAYCQAFDKLKLDYTIVDADSGAMGGSGSQEFMVKSDVGEDTIAYCDACGYAANSEKAACVPEIIECPEGDLELTEIHTPNVKTIEDLMKFFNADPKLFVKTLIYRVEDRVVAVMVRGDREVNEVKLANYLGANEIEMADVQTVNEVTSAEVGFAGPIGIKCELLMDSEVAEMKNFIVGANKTDYHYLNVQIGRDFTPDATLDLRTIVSGDKCPKCGKEIKTAQGIEVGHIFKLGTKYSEALGCSFLDENGSDVTAIMGCYGIGVSRCIAAIIEQNCDDNGIIWPVAVAPYEAIVVPVNATDETQVAVAEEIYGKLQAAGIEVVMDDRDERAGVKFKDADLLGFPVRITVGKFAKEGIVEFKLRNSDEVVKISPAEAADKAIEYIKSER
ncbi:MAG: proline--tRNA ligase [Clostridia bacterium]|nr:proline--tRNA ligase [Clostridia bacterium]